MAKKKKKGIDKEISDLEKENMKLALDLQVEELKRDLAKRRRLGNLARYTAGGVLGSVGTLAVLAVLSGFSED